MAPASRPSEHFDDRACSKGLPRLLADFECGTPVNNAVPLVKTLLPGTARTLLSGFANVSLSVPHVRPRHVLSWPRNLIPRDALERWPDFDALIIRARKSSA